MTVIAENKFQNYLKEQEANIYGPSGPFDTSWVNEMVWNAAYDIWVKRHWVELPMLADMCEMSSCVDQTILSYLKKVDLHKSLRVHCWILELILKTEPKKEAIDDWFASSYVGR